MKNPTEDSKTGGSILRQVQSLRKLSDRISALENRIAKVSDKLAKLCLNLEEQGMLSENQSPRTEENGAAGFKRAGFGLPLGVSANIIAFPANPRRNAAGTRPGRLNTLLPFLARPGERLPEDITDYRPFLQRDGLLLLAWDKRLTEAGERYTAYWVTSAGTPRFYASKPLPPDEFITARPHHKSYAAEDGIEFYGQEAPLYMVHVAPGLMMSNPLHGELRAAHIAMLKQGGSAVDFNYHYLLSSEKTRSRGSLRGKLKKDGDNNRAGA